MLRIVVFGLVSTDGEIQRADSIPRSVAAPAKPGSDRMSEEEFEGEADDEPSPAELIEEGELCFKMGQHADALRCFNHVISLDPSQGLAWFNRGVLLESNGDLRGARQSFEISLELEPRFAPAAANLAVLLERTGELDEAVRWALAAMDTFSGHPLLQNIIDKSAGVVQKPEARDWTAVEGWGSSKAGPAPSAAIIESAETGKRQFSGDGPKEIAEYEYDESTVTAVMAQHAIEDKEALLHEARMHDRDTDMTLDRTELEAAARTVSYMQQAGSAATGVDIGRLEEQARAMILEGNPSGALSLLQPHLSRDDPASAALWALCGGAKAKIGNIEAAIDDLSISVALDPSGHTAHHNLGVMLRKAGRPDSALEHLSTAVSLDADYVKAASNLISLAEESGRPDMLVIGYRTLLRDDPDHSGRLEFSSLLVGMAAAEATMLENSDSPVSIPEGPTLAKEALLHLRTGSSKEETHLLARARSLADQHVESIDLWKSLLEQDKTDVDIWRGLARSLEAIGELEKAAKCHAKASELIGETTAPEIPNPPDAFNDSADLLSPVEPSTPAALEPLGSVDTALNQDLALLNAPLENAPPPQASPEMAPAVDLSAAAFELQSISTEPHPSAGQTSGSGQEIEWFNKGLLLLTEEKFQEGLTCFDRALDGFQDDAEMRVRVLNGRGGALYGLERFADCILAYHEAMQLAPQQVTGRTLYNLGVAYAEMGVFRDAIKCFEQARSRGLDTEEQKRCKEQIKRCKLLVRQSA